MDYEVKSNLSCGVTVYAKTDSSHKIEDVQVTSNLRQTCNCGSEDCHHEDSPRDFNIAVGAMEIFIKNLLSSVKKMGLLNEINSAILLSVDEYREKWDS